MSIFWLAASGLLLLALGLVAMPWWFRRKTKSQGTFHGTLSNTSITRQRLNELHREEREGLLAQADRQEIEQELKMALLDEQEQAPTSSSSARWVLAIGLVLSLITVGSVYWRANNVQALTDWQQAMDNLPGLATRIVTQGDQSITVDDMHEFALGLRSKLRDKSDDATGWTLLGRVYSATNRPESALQAFDKALALQPNNIDTLANYSQALLMIDQAAYLQQARRLLEHLLTLEPEHSGAVGMLAMVATKLGDHDLALKSWRRLQQFVQPSEPIYQSIEAQIAKLAPSSGNHQNAGEANAAAEQSTTPAAGPLLTITVELAEQLQDKLPETGYLFVYAQDALGSSNMPAAVVKLPLPRLPTKVELSDHNAVMPTLALSQLREARLIARISASEDVSPSRGDLQGKLNVNIENNPQGHLTLVIDEEIQ